MNRLTFIFPTILSVFVSLMFFTSCSKDGPGGDGPEPEEKEFTELNENEQKAYLVKEFNGRGGNYELVGITTYNPDGTVLSGYTPEACEKKIVISVPNEIDKNLEMKQVAQEGACGTSDQGLYHNVLRFTFSNYKAGLSFYTVIKEPNAIDHKAVMYFNPKYNEDKTYLQLHSIRQDDLERMTNGEANVVARVYKTYDFRKL